MRPLILLGGLPTSIIVAWPRPSSITPSGLLPACSSFFFNTGRFKEVLMELFGGGFLRMSLPLLRLNLTESARCISAGSLRKMSSLFPNCGRSRPCRISVSSRQIGQVNVFISGEFTLMRARHSKQNVCPQESNLGALKTLSKLQKHTMHSVSSRSSLGCSVLWCPGSGSRSRLLPSSLRPRCCLPPSFRSRSLPRLLSRRRFSASLLRLLLRGFCFCRCSEVPRLKLPLLSSFSLTLGPFLLPWGFSLLSLIM